MYYSCDWLKWLIKLNIQLYSLNFLRNACCLFCAYRLDYRLMWKSQYEMLEFFRLPAIMVFAPGAIYRRHCQVNSHESIRCDRQDALCIHRNSVQHFVKHMLCDSSKGMESDKSRRAPDQSAYRWIYRAAPATWREQSEKNWIKVIFSSMCRRELPCNHSKFFFL